MPDRVAPYIAHIDGNQVPTSMGVVGTQGTADTGGTAYSLPFAVDSATGAAFNKIINGTIAIFEQPDATSTYTPLAADSTTYGSALVVKSSAGVLYGFTGYNSNSSNQFIQVFNSSTIPNNGGTPVILITAPAISNFTWDGGKFGRYFSAGIAICNSSTGPTKTIGGTDCWFNALYQ